MKERTETEIARGVFRVPLSIVNAYLIADENEGGWVLVDAGLSVSAGTILRQAQETFGRNSRPAAILLTHGHFDHVGSLKALAEMWNVPVYAHPLEMPYLTGRSAYPPPDPSAGGGSMSLLSPLYSRGPIDLGGRVLELPADGRVPHLSGWEWHATPGHSPGHVSFFRKSDRVLVAGDAFVTTRQESVLAAILKPVAIHGPPRYFTCDWTAAADSVRRLAALEPDVAATGHGLPMRGEGLRGQLRQLARDFERVAVPREGRYTRDPAKADERGVVRVPPPVFATEYAWLAVAAGVLLGRATSAKSDRDGQARRETLRLKPLHRQVMVITGASSGIGLATAEAAARKGAKLVLAARSLDALEAIAARISSRGGAALAVECDVSDRAQVDRLARRAVEHFGRIDTWVNNAGLGLWGRLDQTNEVDARRLFDVNFWGVVNGSLAALPHLRQNGGTLINVGSEVSDAYAPIQGMYSATKHAVKGFTDSLRVEIEDVDRAPVSITLIQPTAVDTPFPQHARNATDREPMLPKPMIEPSEVAEAILKAAVTPTRDTKVGTMSKLNTSLSKFLPGLADKLSATKADQMHYDEPPRHPEGALFRPSAATGVVAQTHGTGGREPK